MKARIIKLNKISTSKRKKIKMLSIWTIHEKIVTSSKIDTVHVENNEFPPTIVSVSLQEIALISKVTY